MRHAWRGGGCAALVLAALAIAQQPAERDSEERTRQLWNTKFLENRPAAKAPGRGAKTSAAKPAVAPAPQPGPPQEEVTDALVGVTIWRLRKARESDPPEVRISVAGGEGQWTPERVSADTPLSEGQHVRVSIETARTGHLYVISREQFADGTFGVTELIFPTLRTHGGNNEVTAGRLIEIPAWDDNPPYFTLTLSRPDQVAEVLSVLVTPKPLPGVKIGRDPLSLTLEQVTAWEKTWGARVKRLEARGEIGKPYTKAEKEAGAERTRRLRQDEPIPQTMYHVECKAGDPLLVSVPLRITK